MDSKELRIGNYVIANGLHEGKIMTIEQIGGKGTLDDERRVIFFSEHTAGEFAKHCKGVPLTEQWLIDLGFYKFSYGFNLETLRMDALSHGHITFYRYSPDVFKIELGTSSGYIFGEPSIKYVHQLQNLYFALCGKELIKQLDNGRKRVN